MKDQKNNIEEIYQDPELDIVELTGVQISADSMVCCSSRGMVGYE